MGGTKPVLEQVRAGLDYVRAQLEPRSRGYVELTAGLTGEGWLARAEAGWKPLPDLTVFGYGQGSNVGLEAGAGLRFDW